ncbi:MAG TPA: hypothetical protein PLO05_08955 [Bacteroidales bacterium]|jgi:uncharacterized membrane protein SirB2|nr:hypothetical protein [Bacteroidales bacterium]MDD4235189.1 hypothetical protein [Bacteroidales bacterium]MDY0159839.1 hypothetical protein [Bacteroidales bacterium]HRW20783.1 hypothetical protein [Bacteroidales bacterium]HXK82273.1 hypothetical protein [Bacteroidales bacterium]
MLTNYETALFSLVIAGILVLITGLFLRTKNDSYPVLWFNIHKFISIAASILLGFMVFKFADFSVVKLGGRLLMVFLVALIILEIISGGLLNTKRNKKKLKFMHSFVSLLIIMCSVIILVFII